MKPEGQQARVRGNAGPAQRDGQTEPALGAVLERFLRDNPAEAKRRRREDARNARWLCRRRSTEGYSAEARLDRAAKSAMPKIKRARHPGQRTAIRRGIETLKADPRFAQHGVGIAGCVLAPAARTLPWPGAPDAQGFRDRLMAVVAAQRPWHAVEYARFTATLFDGAEAFYRELRSAYSKRDDLEKELATWLPWTTTEANAEMQARLVFELDGTLSPESRATAATIKRLVRELAPPPKRLHRAWNAAKLREPDTYLRHVPRERGRGATAGREWPRYVRLDIRVAGHRLLCLPEFAGRPGRIVTADFVDSQMLSALYGPARRTGPRAAALEFVAKVIDRSPAQVEKLCASARAADSPE